MPPEDQSGGAPFALYRTIFPLSVSAALSETPGWLATALVGLALVADGYSTAVAGTIASLPAAGVIAMSTILPGIARRFGVVPVFYFAAVLLVTSLLLLVAAANDGALWLWCLGLIWRRAWRVHAMGLDRWLRQSHRHERPTRKASCLS